MAEKEKKEQRVKAIELELVLEPDLDKNGKEKKDETGAVLYNRSDVVALNRLLSYFDSRMHDAGDFKIYLQLRDKLKEAWLNDSKKIELSVNQAAFLKKYLDELTTKDGKERKLEEYEMRTLVGILEVF